VRECIGGYCHWLAQGGEPCPEGSCGLRGGGCPFCKAGYGEHICFGPPTTQAAPATTPDVLNAVLSECLEARCESDDCGVGGILASGTGSYRVIVADTGDAHAQATGHRVGIATWAQGQGESP